MPTPHKHAALIKQWADDPSQTIWMWFHDAERWDAVCPYWNTDSIYAIGERHTQPPRKMCVLAGVEFPLPETEAPAMGTHYFVSNDMAPTRPFCHIWNGTEFDTEPLRAGYLHLTREAAVEHGIALLAANTQAIEAAK